MLIKSLTLGFMGRFLSILLVLYPLFLKAGSDFEYWQMFEWTQFKKGPLKLYASGNLRIDDDASHIYDKRLTQNIAYEVTNGLDVELHYSYIYMRSKGEKKFSNRSRIEVEMTPTVPLYGDLALSSRFRLDILKIQNVNHFVTFYRQRFRLTYPLCHKFIKSISCSNEFFYDINLRLFRQNRFIPISIDFKLFSQSSIFTYLMIRHFHSAEKWYRSIVLGSDVCF